jgi:hypothetical protein
MYYHIWMSSAPTNRQIGALVHLRETGSAYNHVFLAGDTSLEIFEQKHDNAKCLIQQTQLKSELHVLVKRTLFDNPLSVMDHDLIIARHSF